jgi:hypothetical protein
MFGLFFDPEPGGDIFLRKFWLCPTIRHYNQEDGNLHGSVVVRLWSSKEDSASISSVAVKLALKMEAILCSETLVFILKAR